MKGNKKYRKAIAKTHLFLAAVFGVPILITSLTGAILSFERELERWLHPDLFTVTPGTQHLPKQELWEKVRAAYPEMETRFAFLPLREDDSLRFHSTGSIPTQVFIDPYTGEILGDRTMDKSLTAVTRAIHVSFLVGKIGNRFSGLTSLMLMTSLFTGFYLWWSSAIRKRKKVWQVRRKRGFNVLNYDLHSLIGVVMIVPLVIITLSGAVFSFPEFFRPLIYQLTFTKPEPPRPTEIPAPGPGATLDLDRLLALAARENPGTTPTIIAFPKDDVTPMRINQRSPGEAHYTGRHYTFLDPWRESVIENRDPADTSLGTKLIMANRVLHTGELGGFRLRLLFMIASLAAFALVIGGFIHWWLPRRKRQKNKNRAAVRERAAIRQSEPALGHDPM